MHEILRNKKHYVRTLVFVDNPHPQSHASLLLLNRYFQHFSRDITTASKDWRLWLTFRNKYMRRQKKFGNMVCYICGKTNLNPNVNSPYARGREATIDHIVSLARGGRKFAEENLAVCCLRCNQKKADGSLGVIKNVGWKNS